MELFILVREPRYCRQYNDQARDWTIRGSNPRTCTRFISAPKRPDRLLGPPGLLFNGCVVLFVACVRPTLSSTLVTVDRKLKKKIVSVRGMFVMRQLCNQIFVSAIHKYQCHIMRSGVRTPAEARNFLLSIPVQTGPGAQPTSCTIGIGAHSWG